MPLTLLGSYGLGLFSLGGCTAEEEIKQEISLKVHLLGIIKTISLSFNSKSECALIQDNFNSLKGSLKFGYQSIVLSGTF